jgi:hypothetical protein
LVDVGDGLYLTTNNRDLGRVGDRVVLAFRPEFASIGDEGELLNRISGNVVNVLYSGSIIRIRIKLVNGELIVVKSLSLERPKYGIGDSITINVSPENILVYPYPEEGLYKELALE